MSDCNKIMLCDFCGWKFVGNPEKSGTRASRNDSLSSEKYKCLQCGRCITPRKAPDPQKELDSKKKDDVAKAEYDKWMETSTEFQRKFINGEYEQNDDI